MCSVITLLRPGHDWPLLLAANRDERVARPSRPPGRHWADRQDIVAGYDEFAGGSWLGLNDHGVVAAILDRAGSLGPAAGKRSRGELVLEALDHADAMAAADALADLDGTAYRPFNMLIGDNRDAVWLRSEGQGPLTIRPLTAGLHMITSHDLDDPACPRTTAHLQNWRAAPTPDPRAGDWRAWEALLRDRRYPGTNRRQAMFIEADGGYGTVSSALIALPSAGHGGQKPLWRFAPGLPDPGPFAPIEL